MRGTVRSPSDQVRVSPSAYIERALIDEQPAPVTLRGDDHHLTYDENGYPELPACLDCRLKLELVVSNPSASQPLTEAA